MEEARSDIEIRVLDHLGVTVGAQTLKLSPVERNLVSLLAAAGQDGLDTERLADGLWVDRLPATWSASLRNSISRLNSKVADRHPDGLKLISERSSVRRLQVDHDAVDLWRLMNWASDPKQESEPALLLGTPFPGCEVPPLIRSATENVVAARQDVVARWEAEGDALPNQVLAAVRRLCADDPFNQSFRYSAVRLHLASNHPDGARSLIEEAERELEEMGAALSDELLACKEELAKDRPSAPAADLGPVSSSPIRSPAIERLVERPLAGRSQLVSEIVDSSFEQQGPGVILHGNPGTGKTRMAAEVAKRLEENGYHTAYVVADQDTFGTLQPFLDSFRGLREVVAPHLDRLHQPEVHSRSRTEMIEFFEKRYAGHPLCLVVDDVQWFDEQSRSLLLSLCRASLDIDVLVIAIGRARDRSASWPGWIEDLARAGLAEVRIRALDRAAIEELIGARLRNTTRVQTSQLADRLLELSSGVPQVAEWLLQRVDPDSLEIATEDVYGTGFAALISSLTPDVRLSGAIGALLGIRFSLSDLCRLGQIPQMDAGRHVESLIGHGLLIELPMPDEYRFLHVLAAEALGQTLPPQKKLELHATAFRLFSNPHRRAWHGSKSVPLTDATEAAKALVSSAKLSFAEGDFPNASRNVKLAAELWPESVGLDIEVMHLEALERGGVRATAKRALVTRQAIDAGDFQAAAAAAASGLPDTEALEGDAERVAVLKMIDPNQLSQADRIHWKVQLSRQLLFFGRVDEAQTLADEAHAEAETPEQLARTWLASQLPGGLGTTVEHPRHMPWFDKVSAPELRATINQATVINAIGSGQSKSAYQDIVNHVRMTRDHGFVQLEWFAKMYQATALTDQGDRDSAVAIAAEAYKLGLRAGLRIAGGTFETQHFIWKFHEGSHRDFHEHMDAHGPSDITGNIIFSAVAVATLHAFGMSADDKQVLAQAEAALARVGRQAQASPFDTEVIGIVADVIADRGSPELVEWATETLVPRHGSFLLLASAAANMGPVEGVTAKLARDRSEQLDLYRQAVAVADRHDLALWQVLGRLRLAAAMGAADTGSNRLLSEASDLAVTRWLHQIVDRHTDASGR